MVLYLSGAVHPLLKGIDGVGFMLTPAIASKADLSSTPWAADTGCFSQGDAFKLDKYLAWLDRMRQYQSTCLFATAPDVVGDAAATWDRSRDVLPVIRAMGYPAALVGQDGLECLPVDWSAFDAYFVGGSTDWKLSESAYELVRLANCHGKWTHMGRVNSLRRLYAADMSGYKSADGTFVRFGGDANARQLIGWVETMRQQRPLFGG